MRFCGKPKSFSADLNSILFARLILASSLCVISALLLIWEDKLKTFKFQILRSWLSVKKVIFLFSIRQMNPFVTRRFTQKNFFTRGHTEVTYQGKIEKNVSTKFRARFYIFKLHLSPKSAVLSLMKFLKIIILNFRFLLWQRFWWWEFSKRKIWLGQTWGFRFRVQRFLC